MTKTHYIGDEGTAILVDCGMTITTASVTRLYMIKPDGTSEYLTATISGTDSLSYTVVAGDFDQAGTYSFNSYVEIGAWKGHGETDYLSVRAIGE
jgi:hypothetical protein